MKRLTDSDELLIALSTIGQPFYDFDLSSSAQKIIEDRIKNDILWEDLKVIFTGSEVPGEGEHKVKI